MIRRKSDWIASCEHKARHLLARKLASPEELARLRPTRRAAPLEQWLFYYSHLVRLAGREDSRVSHMDFRDADAEVLRALRAEPKRVELLERGADGASLAVQVHPKSYDALLWFFHVRDWLLIHLADRVEAIRAEGLPHDVELLDRCAAELSYQMRLVAWGACTEGPGLPFSYQDECPEIPTPFRDLSPSDLLRIHEAFIAVNAGQLQALERLVQSRPGADGKPVRPSWSIFFSQLAMRLKTDAARLMRDQSLAQHLATVKLAAPPEAELEEAGVG